MTDPLTIGGWSLVGIVLGVSAMARRIHAQRMDAVAVACHELRGPLSAIALGLELGSRAGSLAPGRLRAIELELGRATLALDDLAAVREASRTPSAASGTSSVLRNEDVDVVELLAGSVEAWRPAAAAAGVQLRLDRPHHAVIVGGERLRLAQATGNLIANAIEHGGGVVEVSIRSEGRRVRIEVVDGGPGLPVPIAQLTRPRRRGSRSRRRGLGQRGHGLAVASAVAAAHGGRLAAAPSERGARMVLELPLAEAPAGSGSADG